VDDFGAFRFGDNDNDTSKEEDPDDHPKIMIVEKRE